MTAPAIAAATLVLLRDAPGGWQVLLLQRHAATAFAGGAMVFPGGRVEPGDGAIAADDAVARGFAGLEATDAAARVAAVREAFEEAGILVAGSGLAATELAAWRTRLNAGTADFADLLRATGTTVDAARLVPFANWVPPAAAPIARRFDTLFYLARLPAGEEATPDGGEAVAAQWTTPAAALASADAGDIALIMPTRRNLERLAQYPSIDALLTATAARAMTRIQPQIVMRDDGEWLTIPTGCDYPVTEEPLGRVRRE